MERRKKKKSNKIIFKKRIWGRRKAREGEKGERDVAEKGY